VIAIQLVKKFPAVYLIHRFTLISYNLMQVDQFTHYNLLLWDQF
jgi:hypothetical protein